MECMECRLRWGFAVAVVLVIVAAGFCVFHQSHDAMSDHGMSLDLCAGLLVFSLAVPLLAGPGMNGWYRPALVRSSCVTGVRALDPPPKF